MRLAVLCSGGDAPGMNTAVWRLVAEAEARGWHSVCFRNGYTGLLAGSGIDVGSTEAARHARHGGAWLEVAREPAFESKLDLAAEALRGFDALAVIGGDGSLRGAAELQAQWGRPVVGLPATIDNDIAASDLSIGHDTAIAFGVSVADRLRDTAEALPRFFCLVTLGGSTGHLALAIGRVVGAQAVLLPEAPITEDEVLPLLRAPLDCGAPALLVASEGYPDLYPTLDRLSADLGSRLRASSVGHAQRGGAPTPRDRALAMAFADAGLAAISEGVSGMAILQDSTTRLAPFSDLGRYAAPDPEAWRGLI